jgi:hypothetical protein
VIVQQDAEIQHYGFMWLGIGTYESSCEHGNESFRFIKDVEFLD